MGYLVGVACDGCDKMLVTGGKTELDAWALLWASDWVEKGDQVLCPACQEKQEDESD